MTLQPDSLLAGYRIERVLGAGGMGTVYLARHPRLPRSVALKVLDRAADAEFRARFDREAELAARLDHPNVAEIYDRGADAGHPWIAMRYVPGTDVGGLIRQAAQGLSPQRAVHLLAQAAAGLDAAHRRGLIHRDVKPANLLVGSDNGAEHVFVTDFGIARAGDDAVRLTATGAVVATLAYVAPEQILGAPIDHRVDVYSLGCTCYEMLTGTVPFGGRTPAAMVAAHLDAPPPRPSAVRPGLPPALDEVIARAMAKDPHRRYPSCGALAAAARQALDAPPPTGPAPNSAVPQRVRRTTVAVVAAAVAVIAAVAVAAAVLLTERGASDPAVTPVISASAEPTATPSPGATVSGGPPPITAWGRDNDLVALFPGLLPARPDGTGYQGARCADLNVLNNGGAPAVSCTQDNGITWTVWSFRRGDPRRDAMYTTKIENDTTREQPWTRASGTGRLRSSYYPGGGSGLLTVAFDDPARAWTIIDVGWDGHTGQDLVDTWWATAPL
ncbi:serine/threonine-protein kinase [Nocardia wallacei]|uniref:serine/threonine-protein kinase n=1 Tax=Nocardia wallacei TaxID=480035 RepID=UPI002454E3AA|nr:serine/threonine-protein kinase [Nocardia wallacei]